MTANETAFTRWPPTEENEHEVVKQMKEMYAAKGVVAAAAYVRRVYIKGTRTAFSTAEGNFFMAGLMLSLGDTVSFDRFHQAAVASSDCTGEYRRQLLQMHGAWMQFVNHRMWLPRKWRIRLAARMLKRYYV